MIFDNVNRFLKDFRKLIGRAAAAGSGLPGETAELVGGAGDGSGSYATGTLTVSGGSADIYITGETQLLLAAPNGLTSNIVPRTPGNNDFYGVGTPSDIAADIAAAINDPLNAFSTTVTAVAVGPVVNLTAVHIGTRGNIIGLNTSNPPAITPSGPNLTGGVNPPARGTVLLNIDTSGTIQADLSGNTRGISAVDLQATRSAANQVAGGDQSFIAGGKDNLISNTGLFGFSSGDGTTVSGYAAHSEGMGGVASGTASHVEGSSGAAQGAYSHVEGSGGLATAESSHVEGDSSQAQGLYSHAEGSQTTVGSDAEAGHAEGETTLAQGRYTHAEGFGSTAGSSFLHDATHAEGYQTSATAIAAHTEGYQTIVGAESVGGHAEGYSTLVQGDGGHAEGMFSFAGNQAAHAEGANSQALAYASHSGGVSTYVDPNAEGGHAVGRWSAATNIGEFATASGLGSGTQSSDGQLAGSCQTSIIDAQATTTDATPTALTTGDIPGSFAPEVPGDNTWASLIIIVARDHGNGDSAMWMYQALWRGHHLSPGVVLVGSAAIGTPIKDAGAAAWTTSLSTDINNQVVVTGTGEIGKTIQWHVTYVNSVSGSGYNYSD